MMYSLHSWPHSVSGALIFAVMATACAPLQMYPGKRLPPGQVAVVSSDVERYWKGGARSVEIVSVDGEKVTETAIEILPGVHRIEVEAKWSNGWKDKSELPFSAMAGERYLVGIYELRPGEDPETADFRERTSGEVAGEVAGAAIGDVLMYSSPISIFLAPLIVSARVIGDELAEDRPFQDCCFLWIQEKESGRVLAGVTPRGSRSNQP
jgi:hypothetical protein